LTSEQFQCSHSMFTPLAQACMAECALSTWGVSTIPHSKLLTTQVQRRWSSFVDGSQRIKLCMTIVNQPAGHMWCWAQHVAKAAAPILLRLKGGGRPNEKVQTLVVEEASFSCRDNPSTEMVYHQNALEGKMLRICSSRFNKRFCARKYRKKEAKLFALLKDLLHAPWDSDMGTTLEIAISSIDSMLGKLRSQPLLVEKRIR